ncbi:MAG: hypothetical protein MHMPM18_001397 [Marteilia pararefringens]
MFILFLTSKSIELQSDTASRTINSTDIIHAMRRYGFEDYVPQCTKFLEEYNKHKSQRLNEKHNQKNGTSKVEAKELD